MSQPTLPGGSLASPGIAIWLPWYFKRGSLSLLTIPVFLFLAWGFFDLIWAGIIYFLALTRASGAVFGNVATFAAWSFAWIPAFAPAILYYSLLKNLPGVWLRRDVTSKSYAKLGVTVGMLILLVGAAEAITKANSYAIAWIADRDPCSAYRAGVTGNILPKSDCLAPAPVQARGTVSARDLTCADFIGLQDDQKAELAYGYFDGFQAELEKDEPDVLVPPSDARHPMWWVLPEELGQNPFTGLAQKLDLYCKSGDNGRRKLLDAFLSIAYKKDGFPDFGISFDTKKTDPWKKMFGGMDWSVSCSAYSASPEETRQAIVDGYYLGTQALKVRLKKGRIGFPIAWPSKSSPETVRIEVDKTCEKDKGAKLHDALWVATAEMAVKQK